MHLQHRILVTGGSGFLGSHLCEKLLARGASVLCVDNFFTGERQNSASAIIEDMARFVCSRDD
jgi:UDP-glucuronate decarboxylase